jgi:predicted regulator of Ras-like GTPase activity (Roadblock/LC7/MglB family)
MLSANERLRADRLVFYADDIDHLDEELDGFLEMSGARCAMLIDRSGHLVTRRGETVSASQEAIAALVAGSFAATREMARLLGEEAFNTLFHQGARESIQVSQVTTRALFAIVFDERSNLGLVRFYAQETQGRLGEILERMAERSEDPKAADAALSPDYTSSARAALDELF